MTVVIKRLQVPTGSAQTLKVGAAPKGFFTAVPLNDNRAGVPLAPASPMTAAYDALAQETFFVAETKDEKNSWSLDWY